MADNPSSAHRFGPDDPDPWMHPMEVIQWLWATGVVTDKDIDTCENMIDEALYCGLIMDSGICGEDIKRKKIEADYWQDYRVEFYDRNITRRVQRDPGNPCSVEYLCDGDCRYIRYRRADVLQLWSQQIDGTSNYPASNPPSLPSEDVQQASAINGTQDEVGYVADHFVRWLIQQMRDAPTNPRPKKQIKQEAEALGLEISGRGLDFAWRYAVRESGAVAWSAKGRRPGT